MIALTKITKVCQTGFHYEASWNSITRTNAQFIYCRVLSEIKFLKSCTAVDET